MCSGFQVFATAHRHPFLKDLRVPRMGIFNGDGGEYVKVPSGKRMFENILKSQLYAHFDKDQE